MKFVEELEECQLQRNNHYGTSDIIEVFLDKLRQEGKSYLGISTTLGMKFYST